VVEAKPRDVSVGAPAAPAAEAAVSPEALAAELAVAHGETCTASLLSSLPSQSAIVMVVPFVS
jgi:hypothetical protein